MVVFAHEYVRACMDLPTRCQVAKRLAAEGCAARAVTLLLKTRKAGAGPPAKHLGHGPCDTRTRTRTLPTATTDPDVILRTALALLAAAAPAPTDVRGVGLTLARLAPPSAPHAAAARLAAPLSDGDNDDDDDWALGEETGRHRKEKTTKRKTVAAEEKTKKRKEEFEELPTVSQVWKHVHMCLCACVFMSGVRVYCIFQLTVSLIPVCLLPCPRHCALKSLPPTAARPPARTQPLLRPHPLPLLLPGPRPSRRQCCIGAASHVHCPPGCPSSSR
eukprot:m.111405 g.111405  ORF g.111405 m.111405 type:complete len:275 (-) comp14354_c1_seq10:487-1311(-)